MRTYRKQPFGYRIEMGQVVICPDEAEQVEYIFCQYNLGASFQELANVMRERGIPYDEDKPWNKNRIARILEDARYCGDKGYPVIIDQSTFSKAREKRSAKAASAQKTEAQKMLRRKCTFRITPRIENEVLCMLNSLVRDPDQIVTPKTTCNQAQRLEMLKSELEDLLERLPVDEERTREKLKQIAIAMYETIDPREYETYRMRELFRKEVPRTELDINLIARAISEIQMDGNGRVKIKLKNEQILGREDDENE